MFCSVARFCGMAVLVAEQYHGNIKPSMFRIVLLQIKLAEIYITYLSVLSVKRIPSHMKK